MLNVGYHAYPRTEKEQCFWWIMAEIIDEKFYIVLCDRGVGIPSTLKTHGLPGLMKEFLLGQDDAKMIKTAMKYTRSSRNRSGGGLGSRDIQALVLEKQGKLTIISGRGFYSLEGESKAEKATEMKQDVRGTLIQWEIPFVGST